MDFALDGVYWEEKKKEEGEESIHGIIQQFDYRRDISNLNYSHNVAQNV